MIAIVDCGIYRYDVGCAHCCIWLIDIVCIDEGRGDGSRSIGKRRRYIGVLRACCANDARIKCLQDDWSCDGSQSRGVPHG